MSVESQSFATTGQQRSWLERVPAPYWVLGILLLIMPAIAGDFILFQIFGWTFILGIIALLVAFNAELKAKNYPDNVKVIAEDSRTEIYRPLVGSSLNVNINNIKFEQEYFLLPASILLLIYLVLLIKKNNCILLH